MRCYRWNVRKFVRNVVVPAQFLTGLGMLIIASCVEDLGQAVRIGGIGLLLVSGLITD